MYLQGEKSGIYENHMYKCKQWNISVNRSYVYIICLYYRYIYIYIYIYIYPILDYGNDRMIPEM